MERVGRLILATGHGATIPTDPDTRFLCDLDLTILSAPPGRYDRYAHDSRHEYAWVPDDEYRVGRRRVLEQFLARPHIYTAEFWEGQEEQARSNLNRELAKLGEKGNRR